MRTHDQMIVCRLPKSLRDKTRQLCREENKSESEVLREGLMTLLNQREFQKHELEMLRQF